MLPGGNDPGTMRLTLNKPTGTKTRLDQEIVKREVVSWVILKICVRTRVREREI